MQTRNSIRALIKIFVLQGLFSIPYIFPGLSSSYLYYRVYLAYHTFFQVSCGALMGIFLGAVWFGVVQIVLTPLFPTLAAQ
jgi:dolichyldiphosphatase